jgi:hypothetical protein
VKFYGFNNVSHTTIYIAEPPVPKPNPFEFETSNLNFRTYKSPGSHKIPLEDFPAESRTLSSDVHDLINSVRNKEHLSQI